MLWSSQGSTSGRTECPSVPPWCCSFDHLGKVLSDFYTVLLILVFFPLPFNLWGDTLRPHKYSTPEQNNQSLYLESVDASCWTILNYDDCKMIFKCQHSFHIYQLASAFYGNSPSSSRTYLFICPSFYCQYEFINSYFFQWFIIHYFWLFKLSQNWQVGALQTRSYVSVMEWIWAIREKEKSKVTLEFLAWASRWVMLAFPKANY